MASTVLAPGTVVSRHDARVAAETSGRLTWVAEVGDRVEAGGVIARVDDQLLKLQLADAEAIIRRLEASIAFQEKQVARQRELGSRNIAAQNLVDEAEAQLAMARQELVQARIARDQTRLLLERSQVRAPFAGRIVERLREAGEYLQLGGEVARLVDIDNVEVRAQAPMTVAHYLDEGMEVDIRDRDRHAVSAIRTVVPVGDERSRMIEVRVSLPDPDWVIGSAVRVSLPRSEPVPVVAVPRDALVLRQEAVYVFRVADDDTVEQVGVEPGIGEGEFVQVDGGIVAGDRVVVRGGERLRTGQSITVVSGRGEGSAVKVARAD
jgi:RND family efflux transporter MFP subunit